MKFLILLLYYQRPVLVKFALESIKKLDYDNWELAVIDDGSETPILPIMNEMNLDYLNKTKIYTVPDTIQQKIAQGGSRFGEYINKAIMESDADAVVVLCDDDALVSNYFTNLNKYFKDNIDKKYCYSHVIVYNPMEENPFEKQKTEHWVNKSGDINPYCAVDSSQVAIRMNCFKEDGLRFPYPQTRDLDATIFAWLFQKYGPCSFTGFESQYKAYFSGQLGQHTDIEQFNKPNDN